MSDPHNLSRFLEAQAPVYDTALRELERGRKQSHWMWFIFPQLAGLGHSPTAIRFSIPGWTRLMHISPTRCLVIALSSVPAQLTWSAIAPPMRYSAVPMI